MPESGIIPVALAQQRMGGRELLEDEPVPVLPQVPKAEEAESCSSGRWRGWRQSTPSSLGHGEGRVRLTTHGSPKP
jgi:hypothetical protein